MLGISVCLITLGIRQILGSRSTSRPDHGNVEYVMLENADDEDDNNNNHINARSAPLITNGHRKYETSTDKTDSRNQNGDHWNEEESWMFFASSFFC